LSGFETRNKYEIKDSLGQQVFFVREGWMLFTFKVNLVAA